MKRHRLYTISIAIAGLFMLAAEAKAQIVVDDTLTPEELAATLVGTGVVISGVTIDCHDGGYAYFECVDCNVGMESGIVIVSGPATEVEGPNSGSGTGMSMGGGGDPDLEDLTTSTTYDACILEFDATVTSDSLQFDYVFGSEEYTTYVNSSFNDVFGFFISGPGIVGTQNLALVPFTTTSVAINNVNPLENEEYYVDNGVGCTPSFGGCTEDWLTAPYTTDDYYIEWDGFTTVLTARAAVTPCETYHLKLGVADAGDGILDSGVFIKAGSLSSPGVNISYEYDIDGYPEMIEGCNNGELNLSLSFVATDTIVVNLEITGTAGNGIDYSNIPTSVVFYPGDSLITIPIEAYEDALAEGVETIIITGELTCAIAGDSIILQINDSYPFDAWPEDTIICPGESVDLQASGAQVYIWTPINHLDTTSGPLVTSTPEETITYTVLGHFYACLETRELTIHVEESEADAGPDAVIYQGTSTELDGSGGVAYSWTPAESLSDPNIPNPEASPEEGTTYYLTVTTALGCEFTDSVNVAVLIEPQVYIPNAFTPNGDGTHDILRVLIFNEVTPLSFQIYNRWGKKVFETGDISIGWDGKVGDKEQEIGTYMYIFVGLDERGNEFTMNGTITLLR